jgi:hypothetical protein
MPSEYARPVVKKRKTRANRKKIKITSTSPKQGGSALAAGGHKLMALQKNIGFVKPDLAKKLTQTEKWIKKRNFGIKGTGRNPT